MTIRLITASLVVALLTLTASPALAQTCEAPPGSAAVDQYCEAIPEGSGSQSGADFQRSAGSSSSDGTSGSGTGSGLSDDTARELRAAGSAGAAVEQLSRASRAKAPSGGSTAQGDVAGVDAASDDVSGSPLKAIPASVENGPVAGPVLVWALLAATLALLGLGWVAYRHRDDGVAGSPSDTREPPAS